MFLEKLGVREFVLRAPQVWRDLEIAYTARHGYAPSPYEVSSWQESLPVLAEVLSRCPSAVADCQVYLEYEMPSSSARADAMVVGLDDAGSRAAAVVELKQWDSRSLVIEGTNIRVLGELHPHPSDQVLGYADYLAELSAAFADQPNTIRGCAYLHNAQLLAALVQSPFDRVAQLAPVFGAGDQDRMATWIGSILAMQADSQFQDDLESDRITISKTLFDTVAKAVRGEPAWVLVDEQIAAFHQILDLATKKDGEKHLVPRPGHSCSLSQVDGACS